MECDVLLTHEQVGEEAPATSSTDDFFLAQRTSVPIGFVISVSPPVRPYKIWYKHGQQWEKASREVRCKFIYGVILYSACKLQCHILLHE